MARIRTVKPEFWDSPGTAASSLRARLLFIAMWNWADDWGVGTANAAQLISFAFPNDGLTAEEFPSLAKEVQNNYEVKFYTVRGRSYYAIPSWDKHQKTERKAKRAHPAPDDPLAEPYSPSDLRSSGTSSAIQGDSGSLPCVGEEVQAREREQGNRGTGEVPATPGGAAADVPGRELALIETPERPQTTQALVAEWLEAIKPSRPPATVVKRVGVECKKLLDEGQPFEDVRAGLALWAERGKSPSLLPDLVHEAQVKSSGRKAPTKTYDQRARDDVFGSAMARARAKESQVAI